MSGSDPAPQLIVRPCFQQDLETVQLIYGSPRADRHGLVRTRSPPTLEEMTGALG